MKDRVFQLQDGWYCTVEGRTFGTWMCREYAIAGMAVEQRRAAKIKANREAETLT